MRTILAGAALGLMLVALTSAPVTSQGRGAAPKSGPDVKGPAPRLPNGKPSMAGVWMAKEIGAFEKYGVRCELLYIGAGSVAVQAMMGGEV